MAVPCRDLYPLSGGREVDQHQYGLHLSQLRLAVQVGVSLCGQLFC
jgi:hypothetical protein